MSRTIFITSYCKNVHDYYISMNKLYGASFRWKNRVPIDVIVVNPCSYTDDYEVYSGIIILTVLLVDNTYLPSLVLFIVTLTSYLYYIIVRICKSIHLVGFNSYSQEFTVPLNMLDTDDWQL